jgi:hypothetical protein
MSFVAKLREEISSTEAELASDPRWVRLRALRDMLRLYESDPEVVQLSSRAPAVEGADRKRPRTSSARKQALEVARNFLATSSVPIPTASIYEVVRKAGVLIGGENPKNNLSAMLYHAPDFASHGRQGWTLIDAEMRVAPSTEAEEAT